MAEERIGRGHAEGGWNIAGSGRRRRRAFIRRPEGWPRYLSPRRLKSGAVAYYWTPTARDLKAGFTLHRQPLGTELAEAWHKAESLNAHLDAWREGGAEKSLDHGSQAGTLDWLCETYLRSDAFKVRVSERVGRDYRRELQLVCDVELGDGRRVGGVLLKRVGPNFADRLYKKLLQGPRGKRITQANTCISRVKYAWKKVQARHRHFFHEDGSNPFDEVTRESQHSEKIACSRAEAFALADAIASHGHPHLAVAPLICFEWHMRPENLLEGHLKWIDWRGPKRPKNVRICHAKTKVVRWMPLEDAKGRKFFPELEKRLTSLDQIGDTVVVTPGVRGSPHRYTLWYARSVVRDARRAAGLPEYVSLDSCRHGGLTELGTCGLPESYTMGLSGHQTPDAARGYDHHEQAQLVEALKLRRSYVARTNNARKRRA